MPFQVLQVYPETEFFLEVDIDRFILQSLLYFYTYGRQIIL